MSEGKAIKLVLRVVVRYGLVAGFLAVAMLAARHQVYWLSIAGVIGAGAMIAFIMATTKGGAVTLDAYKDQQIMVDRNKID
ncbi:hypothetical protein [Roseovarius sp.]|uniref:hypothetical protein n=1 Tax=Roseovarius sp. TaxID=1486281 RepID=UPI003BA942EA